MSIRKSVITVRKGRMTIAGRHWLTAFYTLVPLIFISSNICYANVYSKQFFKFIALRSYLQFTWFVLFLFCHYLSFGRCTQVVISIFNTSPVEWVPYKVSSRKKGQVEFEILSFFAASLLAGQIMLVPSLNIYSFLKNISIRLCAYIRQVLVYFQL